MTLSAQTRRIDRIHTRDEIEALIAQGRHVFIYDGRVIKADAWLDYHPGGDIAIKHMVGRDATDEINALHSSEAVARISKYQIGRVNGSWTSFVPPIQGGHFRSRQETASLKPERLPLLDVATSDDSPSSPSSAEQSPIFDAAESSLRFRDDATGESGHSSATSISSFDMTPDDSGPGKKQSPLEARLQHDFDADLAKYPALDVATQSAIVQRYRDLKVRMEAEGLFNCNYTAYAVEVTRYTMIFAAFLYTLRCGWYCTSALCLGMFWHQLVFTAHDAGHMGITHSFHGDTVIGILIADFLGGLSIGWWKRNHNVHHIVTNSTEHDPDIEHLPFFAISTNFFKSLRSTYYNRVMAYDGAAKFFVRFQNYLYYPVMLFGRFNLYVLSWDHLIFARGPRKGIAWWHRWLEIAGQVFFWTWYGYLVIYKSIPTASSRIAFILISNMVTMILHVQITLSHFAMSTSDLGVAESFPQRMLRTTMDVDCPQWLDFFHGGLQFQAIHHLYPRMPRHNLRQAQKLVQQFCQESEIPYALYGFVDGNKEVLGRLGDVARQAKVLAECQRAMMAHGVHDHTH